MFACIFLLDTISFNAGRIFVPKEKFFSQILIFIFII